MWEKWRKIGNKSNGFSSETFKGIFSARAIDCIIISTELALSWCCLNSFSIFASGWLFYCSKMDHSPRLRGGKFVAWPPIHSEAIVLGECSQRLVRQISAKGIKTTRVDRSSRARHVQSSRTLFQYEWIRRGFQVSSGKSYESEAKVWSLVTSGRARTTEFPESGILKKAAKENQFFSPSQKL